MNNQCSDILLSNVEPPLTFMYVLNIQFAVVIIRLHVKMSPSRKGGARIESGQRGKVVILAQQ